MDEKLPEDMSFGEWLHQRRRLLDLTQQQLADQVGCAHITLRRIESGTLKPSKELALILLEKLGAPQADRDAWLRFARGLSGFPGKPADAYASKPITNLPTSLTSFIGREKEQQEVIDLLNQHQLITLTGSGGVGKTRLSLQIARNVLGHYPDGVWLVELASILDPLLVPRTAAIAIGLRDEPKRPILDTLCDYLRRKNTLLILDNCEHLVGAIASMVDKVLRTAPNLRILATSREVLGIAGEVTYLVPSLALPDIEQLPPVAALSQYDAVALFIDRATTAVPAFAATTENALSIAQICHRLDGIPLAIELAAAKVRALSADQIAQRLDDRFRLLTGGNRTALERHRTLRAAIDWSYNLLPVTEQVLFRRLSIFVGGWTLEAAESACANEIVKSEHILNLLEQLINKSLVTMEETKVGTRYRMLETIRQYANEKLVESGESDPLRDRHLDYFLKLAETAEPHLLRSEPLEWLAHLNEDHENLRAALRWSLSQKKLAKIGLQLAVALSEFWDVRGYASEGRSWLEQALSQTNDQPTRTRAMAFMYLTDFSMDLGAIAEAEAHAIQSMMIFRQLGTEGQLGLGTCLRVLGNIAIDQNDYQKAQTHLTEALKNLRASGDQDQIARALNSMSYISRVKGNYILAQSHIEEALKLAQGKTAILACLRNLGTVLYFQGAYQRAQEVLEQGLKIAQELGSKPRMALMLTSIGNLQRACENYEEAARCYHQALNLVQEVGGLSAGPSLFSNLGYVALAQGNESEAEDLFIQGLRQLQKMGERIGIVITLLGIAGVACARKDFVKETKLLSAIAICLESMGVVLEPPERAEYDRFIRAAHSALSDQEFEQAWAEGYAMTIEQAIEYTLATDDDSDNLRTPKA